LTLVSDHHPGAGGDGVIPINAIVLGWRGRCCRCPGGGHVTDAGGYRCAGAGDAIVVVIIPRWSRHRRRCLGSGGSRVVDAGGRSCHRHVVDMDGGRG